MNIVLVEPEIPPNTGNIARLCAATNSTLHLIEPLGFKLDEPALRRAGMDYWHHVTYHCWPAWTSFTAALPSCATCWYIESNGPRRYCEAQFGMDDYIIFGRETAGLPQAWLDENRSHWLRIPMFNRHARSLNLSNCAALVLFEALRQNNFLDELAV